MSHVSLSETNDWQLVDDAQDIRGLDVIDATGARLGRVEQLFVNTVTEEISTVLLDDGTGIPVSDLTLRDGVVYVDERATEAIAHSGLTTDTDAESDERTGETAAVWKVGGRVVRRMPGDEREDVR